jgi:hypothetical protein
MSNDMNCLLPVVIGTPSESIISLFIYMVAEYVWEIPNNEQHLSMIFRQIPGFFSIHHFLNNTTVFPI